MDEEDKELEFFCCPHLTEKTMDFSSESIYLEKDRLFMVCHSCYAHIQMHILSELRKIKIK